MNNSIERIFAVEDGKFEDLTAKQSFNEDLMGKRLIVFAAGRKRINKGFLVCPESKEEINEAIEALKQYKLSMKD